LGTSAFNVTKIAKPKAKRGRKPKEAPSVEPETTPSEPLIEEAESQKVVQSDTDPEWVDDEDEDNSPDAPPWIEEDDEDPFGGGD
jgi:hypothetical protein